MRAVAKSLPDPDGGCQRPVIFRVQIVVFCFVHTRTPVVPALDRRCPVVPPPSPQLFLLPIENPSLKLPTVALPPSLAYPEFVPPAVPPPQHRYGLMVVQRGHGEDVW